MTATPTLSARRAKQIESAEQMLTLLRGRVDGLKQTLAAQ
jgi:hypothetical protein